MKHNSNAITTVGFICLGLTSLCYLVPLAIVHPIPELLFAIVLEIVWFTLFLAMRIKHMVGVKGRAQDAVVQELTDTIRLLRRTRKIWRRALVVILSTVFALALVDLTAYLLAFSGNYKTSQIIYSKAPVSCLVGLNAGASLEILGGAYVESGKLRQSLPIFAEIEQIRASYYGTKSQKMAAIYADYGDLYAKMGAVDMAEQYYKRSIALANDLLGNSGTGRAYTRLANLLTAQGRLDEAAQNYEEALAKRTKQFGPDSAKVAETLFTYSILLDQQGKRTLSASYTAKAQSILARLRKQNTGPNYTPIALLAVSLIASWILLGKKGLLTKLAVKRLKRRVEASAAVSTASAQDLKTLILLCQYQKDEAEVKRYKRMAALLK